MPDLKVIIDDSPQRVAYVDNSPETSVYTLPRVAGSSGQVITIDANGDCNFQSIGSIGTLGSIEFRAIPYFDNVNAAADNWSPSGKNITPELLFNLDLISYNAVKTNNTWRYDTGLTFTGGTENSGTTKPALGFSAHTTGNTNPNVTGNFIFTDTGGTDHTFSFRIDWILIQEGAAGSDGAVGTSARGVILTADEQTIEYNKDGTLKTGFENVTVFAEAVNASETQDVFFEFFVDDVSQGTATAAGDDSPFAAQITLTSASTIGAPKKVECQIREGSASNPILARDQIVIFPLKQGSDGITIILSNEAHTLPTTNAGTVTYTDSGTDIEVYEGTTQLSYDDSDPFANSSFRVTTTPTNITVGSASTTGGNTRVFDVHNSMTADNASIEFSIIVKNDEGVERTFIKKQSLAKSKQGAEGSAGSDGRTVTLTADKQLFYYNTNGAIPDPSSAIITAQARNTTGTVYYEFFKDDSQVQASSTTATYAYTPQAAIADMPDKIECEIREGSGGTIVARDQFTTFGLQPGSSAITIAMNNEAHTITTGPLGDSPSVDYPNSGTNFRVFEGSTQLNYDESVSPAVSTYKITTSDSNITAGSTSTTGGNTRVFAAHSSMTANDALITFTITVKRADGTTSAFTRTQSLSKSLAGTAGEDAKTVRLTAADYVIEYDQSGLNPDPASTITLTATAQNFTDPYFKFTGDGITDETSYTNGASGTDADTFSFSVPADITSLPTGPKTIRVSVAEAAAPGTEIALDSITIASVKEGSGNVMAFLTNDSHVFPANSSGAVTDFDGSGTNIEVYEGATQLDYDGSGGTAGHFTVTTDGGTNITPGGISDSGNVAVVADASTGVATGTNTSKIVFTISGKRGNGDAFSITKNQTFSKSTGGADGEDGDPGAVGLKTASGLLYYTVPSSGGPSAPSGTISYNFSTRAFTGLPANWQTTPVEVVISNTTFKYWTSRYDVTEAEAGGGTGTPSFATPTGSINFGSTIQSDNYSEDLQTGWRIQRDSGDAEFNNIKARGALRGGKAGPRDYIAYASPSDDSPLPFSESGGSAAGKSVTSGFYIGPDDSPFDSPYTGSSGGSYDFIIGDATHQLRFDGSKGRLDLKGVANLGVEGTFEARGNSIIPGAVFYDFANQSTSASSETNVSVRMYNGTLDADANNSRIAHIVTRTGEGGGGAGNTDGRYELKDANYGEMTGGATFTFEQFKFRDDPILGTAGTMLELQADGDAHFYKKVGIGQSPAFSLDLGHTTDAIHLPVGTTAQRPGSPEAGLFRYNSELGIFEGYTSSWGEIGGSGGTSDNATNAAHVLVTDNESTNEENLITFVEGATSATGNVGLEMDGNLTYNPSTGTVSATIFKGNIDAVNGDFDGTLEADAITIGGTAVGSIFSPIAGGGNIVTTGALNSGSITSGFGTINNGASAITTTGVGSFASLDISGDVDVDGTLETDALSINGASVTSTAAEINLLDGSIANTVVNSKAVIYGSSGQLAATTVTIDRGSFTGDTIPLLVTAEATGSVVVEHRNTSTVAGDTNVTHRYAAGAVGASPYTHDAEVNLITTHSYNDANGYFEIKGVRNVDLGIIFSFDAVKFRNAAATTIALDIDSSGNVQFHQGLEDKAGFKGSDGQVLSSTGSQVEWVNASSVGGGGTITGSGTANKIAKWSSSSALTDSLITDDGSTVTVGGNLTVNGTTTTINTTNTTITDNLLELNSGASSNANDSGIIIERGSTGNNALFIWDESADKFALGTTTGTASSTGNITYADAGLIAGSLDISGDIDVDGTTNLDVVDIDGAVNMASTLTVANDLVFSNRTTTDGHIQLYNGANAAGGYAIGVESNTLYQRSDTLFRWYIDTFADGGTSDYMELSTTALTVNAGLTVSGNVGIGTSPDSKLHVRNDGTDVILAKFESDLGANTRDFRIKSPILDSSTYPFRFTTSNSFAFEVDGVENLRIHSNGNVGIGLTAPVNKVEIVGTNAAAATSGSAANGATRLYGTGSGAVLDSGIGADAGWLQARIYNNYASQLPLLLNPNGGNVGVGTAAPASLLHVGSLVDTSVSATYSGTLRVSDATQTTLAAVGGIELPVAANGYGIKIQALSVSGSALAFARRNASADWTESMRIDKDGKVGIGTTSPSGELHVNNSASAADLYLSSETTSDAIVALQTNTGGTAREARIGYDYSASLLKLVTGSGFSGSTSGINIDTSGNVGIGTTSPLSKLNVQQSADGFEAGVSVTKSGVSRGTIYLETSSNTLNISRGSIDSISIDSSGNVGIGTTTPGAKLEVASTSGNQLRVAYNSTYYWDIERESTTGRLSFTDGATSGERLTVLTGGNVGIGTTTPGVPLHVAKAGECSLDLEDTGGQKYRLFSRNSDKVFGFYDVTNPKTWFRYTGNATIGSTKLALLEGGGNVGIGTTAPNSKLTIVGDDAETSAINTATATTLEVAGNGTAVNSGGAVIFSAASGAWKFAAIKGLVQSGGGNTVGDLAFSTRNATGDSTLTERMRVKYNGRVGIGTASPGAILDINDDAGTGTGLRVTGGGGGQPLATFTRDVGSTGSIMISSSGGDPQMRFTSANDNWSIGLDSTVFNICDGTSVGSNQRLVIDTSGNVGIGTTSPIGNLDVNSVIYARPTLTSSKGEVIAAASDYLSGPTYTSTRIKQHGSTAAGTSYGLTNASLGTLEFINTSAAIIATNGGTPIVFATSSAERMRIDSSGDFSVDTDTLFVDASADRVGINTNAPSYSLDVVGNCEIDNQTGLGATQYDEQEILRVAGRASNISTIIFSQFRDAAGTDWTTAGSRIQQKIDSSYMGYMQFNGSGKNYGISWGTGGGTAGPEASTERMVLNSSGNLTVTGDVTAFVSDERLKTRVDTIDNAVEKVCSLNGFIYKFNDTAKDLGFDTEKRHVGLSAQEVEKVLPEVIKPAPVDNKYKTLDYAKIVPLLVEAIKEQQGQIENLQKKLEEMSK